MSVDWCRATASPLIPSEDSWINIDASISEQERVIGIAVDFSDDMALLATPL
jgi:hypothetical protein